MREPQGGIIDAAPVAATRIETYAASIQEAHSLGHGPGAIDELWGKKYQEKAIQIYTQTLPWGYLTGLATQFEATARQMTISGAPPAVEHEWIIVTDYLRNASEVILAFAPLTDPTETRPLESATPSVMEFGLLGEIASARGAETLRRAGRAVRGALDGERAADANPLNPEQLEIVRLLTAGKTIVDVAEALGYSTRSIQRKLTEIQAVLGAAGRHEAIAIAAVNGWL